MQMNGQQVFILYFKELGAIMAAHQVHTLMRSCGGKDTGLHQRIAFTNNTKDITAHAVVIIIKVDLYK